MQAEKLQKNFGKKFGSVEEQKTEWDRICFERSVKRRLERSSVNNNMRNRRISAIVQTDISPAEILVKITFSRKFFFWNFFFKNKCSFELEINKFTKEFLVSTRGLLLSSPRKFVFAMKYLVSHVTPRADF